jgi:hypothetical protein
METGVIVISKQWTYFTRGLSDTATWIT